MFERIIYFANQSYTINYLTTNNKNLYFWIKNKQIFCSYPKQLDFDFVQSVLQKKLPKLITKLNQSQVELINSRFCYFLGNRLEIVFTLISNNLKEQITVNKDKLFLKLRQQTKIYIIKKIKTWLKKETALLITPLVRFYEKKMKTNFHQIIITNNKTILGSNLLQRNILRFSTIAAQIGIEVLHYLIVHEISHDFYPNHSKYFWNLVKKNYPDYQKVQNHIKNFQLD